VILWRWTQKVTSSGAFEVPVLPANLAGYGWQPNDSFVNWGSSVSHLKKAVPCGDLLAPDIEYRDAQGIQKDD
jgi:hypothetical protein